MKLLKPVPEFPEKKIGLKINSAVPNYFVTPVSRVQTNSPEYFKSKLRTRVKVSLLGEKTSHTFKYVAPAFFAQHASVKRDLGAQQGLYDTSAAARAAGLDTGATVVDVYLFEGKYTYKTVPDTSIVCIVPEGTLMPVAGYLSGG